MLVNRIKEQLENNAIPFTLPTILSNFEGLLGDSENRDSPFSYKAAVERDELEAFPSLACETLENWGLHHYYVPCEYGGKQSAFDILFWLLRLISRRDLTIAIGHGKTYLGASPIYVAGNPRQKEKISQSILNNQVVSLGLTERTHGADLIANEMMAVKTQAGYTVSGEKWLINNATRCSFATLFVKSASKTATRNYSLIILDKNKLHSEMYECLPKIKTHGIRGADISGIKLNAAFISGDNLIAQEGMGLEITLKSLQISRTLCASLSLGAADTALRTTLKFASTRKLYNQCILEIPYVRDVLLNEYSNILLCEAVALSTIRCLHVAPDLMSLYSSICKYLIPTKTDSLFNALSGVLGARFYLREELNEGVFQKFYRDNSIVGLFDGSSIINLQTISNQINQIAKNSLKHLSAFQNEDILAKIFIWSNNLPAFQAEKLKLSNHGKDPITNSFDWIIPRLASQLDLQPTENLANLLCLLDRINQNRVSLLQTIQEKDFFYEKLDQSKEKILKKYCLIFAAACCINTWYFNKNLLGNDNWITFCLSLILHEIEADFTFDFKHKVEFFNQLKFEFDTNQLFSLVKFNLK